MLFQTFGWQLAFVINKSTWEKNILAATLSLFGVINGSDSKCLCEFLTEAAKLLLNSWIYPGIYHVKWPPNGCFGRSLFGTWCMQLVYNARQLSHIKNSQTFSVSQPVFLMRGKSCHSCNLWAGKLRFLRESCKYWKPISANNTL